VLQCVAECCSVLQCVEVGCSVLQCVEAGCSVLQCVAVCCSESNKYSIIHHRQTTHCIHCDAQVAVCCSVVYCSVLHSVL